MGGRRQNMPPRTRYMMYTGELMNTLRRMKVQRNNYGYKNSYDKKHYACTKEIVDFVDRMYKKWVLPLKDKR